MAIFLSIVTLLVVVLILRGKAIMTYINTQLDISSAHRIGTWDGRQHGRYGKSWGEETSLRIHYSNGYTNPKVRDAYDAAFKAATAAGKAHQEQREQNLTNFTPAK